MSFTTVLAFLTILFFFGGMLAGGTDIIKSRHKHRIGIVLLTLAVLSFLWATITLPKGGAS